MGPDCRRYQPIRLYLRGEVEAWVKSNRGVVAGIKAGYADIRTGRVLPWKEATRD